MFADIQKVSESLNNHSKLEEAFGQCAQVWEREGLTGFISKANSRQNIRKLVKYVFATRLSTKIHSRFHARSMKEAKRNGHHYDYIK